MAYLAGDPQLLVARQATEGAAVNGQNIIPIPGGFTPGMVDVFVGGACLSFGDYDDTDGMSIRLAQAMAAGTQYRVVVSAPGQTIQPIGGQLAGFRNMIINGACMRASRATLAVTNSVAGYGAVDLFSAYNNQGTATGQFNMLAGQLSVGGLAYPCVALNNQVQPSFAANGFWSGIQHIVEGLNCYQCNNKPLVLSFLFAATNAGTYGVTIRDGGLVYTYAATFNYAGGVVPVSIKIPANPNAVFPVSSGNGIVINIAGIGAGNSIAPVNNAWNNGNYNVAPGVTMWAIAQYNNVSVTNIQLEQNVAATPFELRPYSLEEMLCCRYVWTTYYSGWTPGSTNVNTALTAFTSPAANNWCNVGQGTLPTRMRVVPTGTVYSPKTGAAGMAYRNNAGVDAAAAITTSPYFWTVNLSGTGQANEGVQAHVFLSAEL